MKNIFLLILISFLVGLTTNCSRKNDNNNSAVAVTPTTNNCTDYTYRNGFYYDANGQVVTCNTSTEHCFNFRYNHRLRYHVNSQGDRVNCQNDLFNYNNIYPYNTVFGNGCSIYTHGVFYPVLLGNTLVCARYSYLQGMFSSGYLGNIYTGGVWHPGYPILAGCYRGSPHCKCDSALGGIIHWCWSKF